MSFFGGLVDEARSGRLDRRSFLRAALALGIGGAEATREVARVVVPVKRSIKLDLVAFNDAMKRCYPDGLDELWYPPSPFGLSLLRT